MRSLGPYIKPSSTAAANPKSAPPASLTVVNPRCNIFSSTCAALAVTKDSGRESKPERLAYIRIRLCCKLSRKSQFWSTYRACSDVYMSITKSRYHVQSSQILDDTVFSLRGCRSHQETFAAYSKRIFLSIPRLYIYNLAIFQN